MKENLESYKQALESNKEDVSYLVDLFAETFEEVQRLENILAQEKSKEKRTEVLVNVMIPTTTLPMIISGGILMATDNDLGKPVLYTGLGLLFGCEIVYNCGHFIFNLW